MQITSTKRESKGGITSGPPEKAMPSILTTHHKHFHPEWVARTVLLPGWYQAFQNANRSYWRSLWWAIRLFRESRNFDAVVTGAEHCGMLFAMLQTLLRRPSRRRAHVMIDFPWSAKPSPLTLVLKTLEMRIAAPSLNAIFAHASLAEAERFATALRAPEGLFRFVPFHYSCAESFPTPRLGDYIFSGGNSGRDYATLIDALAGSDRRAIICTQEKNSLRHKNIPENVRIFSVGQEQFIELMASSAAVVVPLNKDYIHPAGHTVVVTAMALGKPIILSAPADYESYIESGRTGLLTPAGDHVQLRTAIDRVLDDRDFARTLGCNARAESMRFAPEAFFASVFKCVDECVAASRVRAGRCSAGQPEPGSVSR